MRRATSVLTLVLAVLLAGCGGSSTSGESGGSGNTDTIQVAVKDGKVTPATHREPVSKGDTVKLIVTTDTADAVHVHGVDIEKATSPGKPVTITFVAKDPGIYDVETHDSGLQLLQLEVR